MFNQIFNYNTTCYPTLVGKSHIEYFTIYYEKKNYVNFISYVILCYKSINFRKKPIFSVVGYHYGTVERTVLTRNNIT